MAQHCKEHKITVLFSPRRTIFMKLYSILSRTLYRASFYRFTLFYQTYVHTLPNTGFSLTMEDKTQRYDVRERKFFLDKHSQIMRIIYKNSHEAKVSDHLSRKLYFRISSRMFAFFKTVSVV